MNTLRTTVAALVTAFVLTGCGTLSHQEKVDSLASIANVAAYAGTYIHLEDNETDIPYFKAAVAALDAMAADGSYQPANLAAALADLPLPVLKGSKGSVIIMGLVTIFDQATNRWIEPITSDEVKQVAAAIRNGMDLALSRIESENQ